MHTFYFSCSLLGLLLPLARAGSLAVSFHDCGDASTDAVVKDVTPKTIATGATTTITGSGSLKKDITGATYTMTMTGVLSTVLVKNCNGDASKSNTCDIVAPLLGKVGTLAYQPVTFPIKAGDITGIPKVAVTLNSGLPASLETTTTTLKVTASNGDKAICVQIMTKAASDASDTSKMDSHTAPLSHQEKNASNQLGITFHDCGGGMTDATIKDFYPKTIMTGATTTLTGSGFLKKDIYGATYTTTMTGILGAVLIKNCSGDASKSNKCDIIAPLFGHIGELTFNGIEFPIKHGNISALQVSVDIFDGSWPASLEATTTTVKVTAADGGKVICCQIMTNPMNATAPALIVI